MKKNLRKTKNELFHYVNGDKLIGANSNMTGDCSGLRGDCSGLRGNCTELEGDLDSCEITDEERKNGIDIINLISAE